MQVSVSDVAVTSYCEVAADAPIASLHATFDGSDAPGALVTGRECVGVVTPQSPVRTRVPSDAPVHRIATPVSELDPDTSLASAARTLAADCTPLAPVTDDGELVGCVDRAAVLQAGVGSLESTRVDEAVTDRLVTIGPEATVGSARQDLHENDVDQLPVVEYGGELVGVVAKGDVASPTVEGPDTTPTPDRDDDHRWRPDGVTDVMVDPAVDVRPDTSLAVAVERLLDRGHEGLVVSREGDDRVTGVVTRTDALRALADDERPPVDLRVGNPHLLSVTSREDIADRIRSLTTEYTDGHRPRGTVRLTALDDGHREEPVVRCVARVWTGENWLAKTAESVGAENALSLAVHRLERAFVESRRRETT
jgi:CBS domain-containing protein